MAHEETRKPDDALARTIGVAAALFLMTASFILLKTGRDALYFQGRGLLDLPKAYIGIAILSLPAAAIVLGSIKIFGARLARVGVPLFAAALLAAFFPFARPGGGPLMTSFFMLVPLAFGVLFSLTWLLAAELLDGVGHRQLARSYSIVGAASILGGVAGGAVARIAAALVEPRFFIPAGAVLLLASTITVAIAQHRFPARPLPRATGPLTPGPSNFLTVLRVRYSILLVFVGMLSSLVGILIEFQFYLYAATSGNETRANASYFANAYLLLNGVALIVQVVLMPRLQRLVGVHGSLMILPGALLAGAALLLASASVGMRSLLRVIEGGLKSSIHRSNWEQAYLPLGRSHRVVAKLLVDGAAARVAEGIAALSLYAWLRVSLGMDESSIVGSDTSWVTYLLILTIAAWILMTRALGRDLVPASTDVTGGADMFPEIPLPDT
ncbi:MAG: hypothetical protein ACKVU1_09150 [bacterium]